MTTYIDAFVQSTGETDETQPDGVACYLFGENTQRHPALNWGFVHQVHQAKSASAYYPTLSAGNYPADSIPANYGMTNGLPFYRIMGNAVHTTADTKQTLSISTTNVKPRLTLIQKLGSSQPQIGYGAVSHQTKVSYMMGQHVQVSEVYSALKRERADITINTPTMPTHASNTNPSQAFDVLTHLKWGTDGSETTINNVIAVEALFSIAVNPILGNSGYNASIAHNAPVISAFNISLWGEQEDVVADAHNLTPKSLLWKVSKSANSNHYFEVDSNGATAYVQACDPVKVEGELVGHNLVVWLQNPTVVVQDYLTDEFYEVPT